MKPRKGGWKQGGIATVVILVVLALIAILLIVNAALVWRSDKQLENQLAAIRAAGDPVSIAEMAGEPLAPESNAATYLMRARADTEAISKELSPVYQSETYSDARPTEAEANAIQAAFDAYPKILPLLQQAAACERHVPLYDYTVDSRAFMEQMLPNVNSTRGTVRLLRALVLMRLAQGDQPGAVDGCDLLLRLCRHFRREPMIVGYLVSVACDTMAVQTVNQVLRAGPLSSEARQTIEGQLALRDSEEAFRWVMKTERAYGIDAFRELPSRNIWFARYFWNRDELSYLALLQQEIDHTAAPATKVRFARSSQAISIKPGKLSQLILPAVQATRRATKRIDSLVRCLRVLNALQGHTERGGADERQLSDLDLPPEVTVDPYTGKPLTVKRQPDGWLVYSVGENLKDDGGQLDNVTDVGVGP
jgi:hypothetical protein